MKKKKKIALFCISAVLVAFLTLGIATLGAVINHNSLSGTMMDDEDIVEGTGTYEWRKNSSFVSYGFTKDNPCDEKFYSNGKHTLFTCDDYITGIYFEKSDSDINLCFSCEFDVSSEMEVFFVFDNGYTSSIVYISSMSKVLGGTAVIKSDDIDELKTQGKDITSAHIVEVWVKTLSAIDNEVYRMMVHGQYVYTGPDEYDWRRTVVDIPFSSYRDKNDMCTEEVYSNGHHFFGHEKDYVNNIWFNEKVYYTTLCYGCGCGLFNSIDAFFVFDNGYVTEIYTVYGVLSCFGGHIDIDVDDVRQMKIDDAHIVEIWVRTNY